MYTDYFPLGIATGKAFCNRKQERAWLLSNFQENTHSLIISPRRYGKTSLVLKAIEEGKYPYVQIDFFSSRNLKDIEQEIIQKISQGLARLMSPSQKFLVLIKSVMKNFDVSLSMQHNGSSIRLDILGKHKPLQNIEEIFLGLERLGEKTKKNIVVFMDEFQELLNIEASKTIEGTLRRIAQEAKFLKFVFSGSNRHLLSKIFEDSQKPLYLLCEKLKLERIKEEDYYPYIHHAANLRWKTGLTKETTSCIFNLTERHPHYMNRLCRRLWLAANPPTLESVTETWKQYTEEEVAHVAQEMNGLSDNQRALLISFAKTGPVSKPYSQEFSVVAGLSIPSIRQALTVLLQQDFIFLSEDGVYQVLDPVMQFVLSR